MTNRPDHDPLDDPAGAALGLMVLAVCVAIACCSPEPDRTPADSDAAIVAALPRSTVRAVQQMTDAQLLAVLASTGRLERDPWAKLWHEPPLTGPRPGVDTTRYVAFARGMAARTVVRYDPARPDLPPAHFEDWPADSQAAFLAREWRCIVFNECGRAADPCVCENQAWTVRKEIP